MLVVGTWSFSKEAVQNAYDKLKDLRNCVEAVEGGINAIESDEKYGPCVVGVGGPRNADGVLEMDAAIMEGPSMKFGAVTGLKGIATPISVARSVMYNSPHSMLTADGALKFAKDHGFMIDKSLLSPIVSQSRSAEKSGSQQTHDTLGLIALDMETPRIAVDDVGACCCSGDGDDILKFCPAFHAVQLMSLGKTPTQACQEVVQTILKKAGKFVEIGILAVNTKGEFGAATSVDRWTDPLTGIVYNGFPYVIMTSDRHQPEIALVERKNYT